MLHHQKQDTMTVKFHKHSDNHTHNCVIVCSIED